MYPRALQNIKLMNSNKRISVVSFSHYSDLYGANRSLLSLIIELKDRIDWWIICREQGDFTDELLKNNIKFSVIPFHTAVHFKPRKLETLFSLAKLVINILRGIHISYLIKKEKVDLIHSNSSVIFIGAIVALFTRLPHIWHIREFVYKDYNLNFNFGRRFFRFWANKASKIVCVSNSVRKECIIGNNITAPSTVIYNGLIGTDAKMECRQLNRNPPVIGVVGVLEPAKNQLSAIKAVEILHKKGYSLILKLIGQYEGRDYYNLLEKYVTEKNLGNFIKFVGFTKDINDIYGNLDVMVMCSHNEAFGRVTIESMMNGVPVVAYDAAGSSELIKNSFTGLLYKGNEIELADQLQKLLTDPDLYLTLSKNAATHAFDHFTIKKYAEKFYTELSYYGGQQ